MVLYSWKEPPVARTIGRFWRAVLGVAIDNEALKNVIFLLGAGASVDAGMPMVKQLTEWLRKTVYQIFRT
jgi:hypothetical protein